MEKDKLEPKLRFPGFTEPWEHRKLATIATFAKGRGYSKNDLTDRGTPLILYGRLYTNYSSAIETVDTYAKPLIGSVYSKGGEVIVPASGETAEDIARASAVISKGFLLGGDLNIINPNSEIDPVFLALQLSNGYLKKELASKAQGKSVVHIHNSDLENLQIIYPSLVEQMKVSTCIRVFEHLITLHQRKEEELQKLKKGLLQKMFPKDGESVPEIRFPNFTDSWEHRKFGELFTFLQNNTLSRADLYPKGIAYNVHYGDVLIKYGEVIDLDVDQAEMIADDVIVKKYLKSKLQNGDLIFADTAEDETVGKTSEIQNIGNRTVISGLHTIPLRPKTEFAFGFLGFLFSSVNFRNELKPLIQGIKVSSISKNALKTLTVKISADVKEQAEISNLLLHLSHAITLHHRKTEELKKLKKALLQQMFV